MREHTVQLGPDRIHYWRNEPPPGERKSAVLLVHGFGGAAVWQWAEQLRALVPDRAVLVPDLLWFGESASRDDDPSLDHQVAALVALLDREGWETFDVVGISYGGMVGAHLTRLHGHRVRRLVLVDSPGLDYSPQDHAELLARFDVDDIAPLILPRDEEAVERLLHVAYHDPPPAPRFALRQVKEQMYDPHRTDQAALLRALVEQGERYASDEPYTAALGLVWGDGDPLFELALGRRIARDRGAPLRVIAPARHAPNIEHPERFNEALLELLDGEPLGR